MNEGVGHYLAFWLIANFHTGYILTNTVVYIVLLCPYSSLIKPTPPFYCLQWSTARVQLLLCALQEDRRPGDPHHPVSPRKARLVDIFWRPQQIILTFRKYVLCDKIIHSFIIQNPQKSLSQIYICWFQQIVFKRCRI